MSSFPSATWDGKITPFWDKATYGGGAGAVEGAARS